MGLIKDFEIVIKGDNGKIYESFVVTLLFY